MAETKNTVKKKILDSPFALIAHLLWNIRAGLFAKNFFGQTAEDAILQLLLKEKKGFYLDIGAGNPIKGSNTYVFYKRGWKGIAIDPVASNRILFKAIRPRDQFIQKIVSSTSMSLNFWEFAPSEYSTTDPDMANIVISRELGVLKSHRQVESIRIADLKIAITPDYPSLLSIDVEGADLDALMSNNWETFLPRVIAVEEFDYNYGTETSIGEFLGGLGYQRFAWTSLTSIFVHESF
jgi:FkbM family methyltransferase